MNSSSAEETAPSGERQEKDGQTNEPQSSGVDTKGDASASRDDKESSDDLLAFPKRLKTKDLENVVDNNSSLDHQSPPTTAGMEDSPKAVRTDIDKRNQIGHTEETGKGTAQDSYSVLAESKLEDESSAREQKEMVTGEKTPLEPESGSLSNVSFHQTPQSEEEKFGTVDSETVEEAKLDQRVFIPKRYILLFSTFLGFVVIYSLRVNLNVAIVAMVNNRTLVLKSGEVEKHVAEFQWESHLQGIVLGSFYYGYWVLQIPGAWIAMKLGGTRVFGYGVLLASLLALITPVATRYSVYALIAVRVFQGLFLGVTFPTNHAIWSKWAPPLERSTLVTMAIAGCPVGNIIAIPTTGILSKYGFDGGWPSVFYFFGGLGVIWYVLWELTAYQSPSHHPTITFAERNFIENSIGERAFDPTKESLPWFSIMTSIPMWAIIFGHFGACWGYYTLFTQMPTYLKDIQHLDIKTMGFVAATPYILKAFVGPVGGISADMIVRRKWLTLRGVRALFYGIGCVLAGTFILMTGYCVRQGDAITMLILGVGFSGLNATGYAVNHLDIGPRYAGVLMGISNTFATIPGFLSPMLTGVITKHKQPSEWKAVFWITFVVYIVCVGLYSVMCSGEKQPWAEVVPLEEEEAATEAKE